MARMRWWTDVVYMLHSRHDRRILRKAHYLIKYTAMAKTDADDMADMAKTETYWMICGRSPVDMKSGVCDNCETYMELRAAVLKIYHPHHSEENAKFKNKTLRAIVAILIIRSDL